MKEENGKNTKNKPKSENLNQQSTLRTVHSVCISQLSYTIQQRTVLIIFPLIFRTIIVAQMLSTGGDGFTE